MAATALTESAAGDVPARARAQRLTDERPWLFALALLTVTGAVLRVLAARQTLFGDELATYWDIHSHSLGGLVSALHGTHIEITPPLYFVLAWFTSHIGHSPVWLRLPSLIAGTLTIPAVYALGARTMSRRVGLLAAAFAALAPFMTYYSAEARAYALMMALVTGSTLALLRAVDTGRTRWWVAYGLCSSAAAYSHYTCAFYLGAQALWVLWAHPRLWRALVVTNLLVLVSLAPWASAIVNANNSPTTAIMSALSPFSLHDIRIYVEHWALGYPYPAGGGLSTFPGTVALVLIGAGAVITLVAIGLRARAAGTIALRALDRRVVLIVALLAATPIGEAVQSAGGTHVFGVRNLAASWPALALCVAGLICLASMRFALAAAALVLAGVAIGAGKMLEPNWSRPDTQSAAAYVQRTARPGDVIIDGSGSSGSGLMDTPGPLTSLDVSLRGGPYDIVRAGTPQERDHPYGFADAQVPLAQATRRAVALARTGRIIAVTTIPHGGGIPPLGLPRAYRLVSQYIVHGGLGTAVRVYAIR